MTKHVLLAGALLAIAMIAFASASTRDHASAANVASQHAPTLAAQDQPSDGGAQQIDDQRIDIMVWTLFACAGAAAVGLMLLAVRAGMGWVKPPPQQDDAHH